MGRLRIWIAAACLAALLGRPAARAEPPAHPPCQERAATESEPAPLTVNLNTASESLLLQLPGIGPSRARAIIAFREAHGGFEQVGQLMRIRGIGRAMLRKLRPFVTLSATGTVDAATDAPASLSERDRVP